VEIWFEARQLAVGCCRELQKRTADLNRLVTPKANAVLRLLDKIVWEEFCQPGPSCIDVQDYTGWPYSRNEALNSFIVSGYRDQWQLSTQGRHWPPTSRRQSILGSSDALSICCGMGWLAQSFDLCGRVNSAIGHDLLDYSQARLDLACP